MLWELYGGWKKNINESGYTPVSRWMIIHPIISEGG